MKNLLISGLIGTAVMAGGFYLGMRLAPTPPAKAAPIQTASAPAGTETPAPDAISLDTLRKTSETMMSVSQALDAREKSVAEREQKVKLKEDEIEAERAALDRTHEKFKLLFAEFQQRLQLVEASQLDQLQKQSALYTSMNIDQSIDMIRAMDDPAISRLFSVMDTKPLAKLVSAWKAKYPDDAQRLLKALDGMSRVLPKEEVALNDNPAPSGVGPSDSSTPETPAPATPGADSPTPDAAPATPADSTSTNRSPADSTSSSAVPPADSTSAAPAGSTPSPDANSGTSSATPPSLAPPPDPSSPTDATPASAPAQPDSPKAPVSTATTN